MSSDDLQSAPRSDSEDGQSLIWTREEPRGRLPTHSRAEIARAALEIADTDGFDAVSMRRVARQLGAGTMTLYHYVRNKDELISLMANEVMGELLVPEEDLARGWREALTVIAIRSRRAFVAHRWTLDRLGDQVDLGPNAMRHFEQSLQAVSSLEIGDQLVFELISQVDDYVFGFALREQEERSEREGGLRPGLAEFLQRELDSGDYPVISRYLGTDAAAGFERALAMVAADDRFDRGLRRLLDGFEVELGLLVRPDRDADEG